MRSFKRTENAFTLLEVIITLTILVSMMYAISTMMRSSFDIRNSLKQNSTVTHRINAAMQYLTTDLSHAFLLSTRNNIRTGGKRRTIFKIDKTMGSEVLGLTTFSHQPLRANSSEGDVSYVVYEVKDSKVFPGRKHLYRGETPRVPERFKDQPPMKIIAEHIQSISFEAWRGDDWSKDKWDSSAGDTENLLPQMVRVSIRVWSDDPVEGEPLSDSDEKNVVIVTTVVYLPFALDFNELKQRNSSFKL